MLRNRIKGNLSKRGNRREHKKQGPEEKVNRKGREQRTKLTEEEENGRGKEPKENV